MKKIDAKKIAKNIVKLNPKERIPFLMANGKSPKFEKYSTEGCYGYSKRQDKAPLTFYEYNSFEFDIEFDEEEFDNSRDAFYSKYLSNIYDSDVILDEAEKMILNFDETLETTIAFVDFTRPISIFAQIPFFHLATNKNSILVNPYSKKEVDCPPVITSLVLTCFMMDRLLRTEIGMNELYGHAILIRQLLNKCCSSINRMDIWFDLID